MHSFVLQDWITVRTLSGEALAESEFLGGCPFQDVIVWMEGSPDSGRVSDWRRVDSPNESAAGPAAASHVPHVETPPAKDL